MCGPTRHVFVYGDGTLAPLIATRDRYVNGIIAVHWSKTNCLESTSVAVLEIGVDQADQRLDGDAEIFVVVVAVLQWGNTNANILSFTGYEFAGYRYLVGQAV